MSDVEHYSLAVQADGVEDAWDGLADNTKKLYRFIVAHNLRHQGNSPTISEMVRAMEYGSSSVAVWHLTKLQNAGLIKRTGEKARGIIVVGGEWRIDNVHAALCVEGAESRGSNDPY